MSKFGYLALWALFCSSSLHANDYYVDLDAGSDTAVGTSGAPWRTLTYAMSTVAPSAGHRVLVRGTADEFSPGESFPIRVPAGVSLEAWDAQNGATILAGKSACLELVGPAHRGQSIRGHQRNLRLSGTPAISVAVVGVAESVDLVVEDCDVRGTLRMILEEVNGQTRWGSCALSARRCWLWDLDIACLSQSISTAHDVLSVSLFDNEIVGRAHLSGLSAPMKAFEMVRNRPGSAEFTILSCLAATAVIEDNEFDNFSARVQASSILLQSNRCHYGSLSIHGTGRLEVVSNRVQDGSLGVEGTGTERIENNRVFDGVFSFHSRGDLTAPCVIRQNYSDGFMVINALGAQPLTFEENASAQGFEFGYLPHASVDILRNGSSGNGSWILSSGMALRPRVASHIPGAPLVRIAENFFFGEGDDGAAITVDATLAHLVIEQNTLDGFGVGVRVAGSANVYATPEAQSFRIERNVIGSHRAGVGVDLDLGSMQADLWFRNNEIQVAGEGVLLRRGAYPGTIRFWNNIVRSAQSASVSGAFAPHDLVWSNLASDGALLGLHLSNITGDPQVGFGSYRLRESSPCVGSGIDPLTAQPGFNIGLDPLFPAATLSFRAQSETSATLSLDAPGSSGAILLFGTAVSDPANVALCDGRVGLDLAAGFLALPFPVSNGALSLPLTLPPGPWTIVVQAVSDIASSTPPCRASNTVVVRR